MLRRLPDYFFIVSLAGSVDVVVPGEVGVAVELLVPGSVPGALGLVDAAVGALLASDVVVGAGAGAAGAGVGLAAVLGDTPELVAALEDAPELVVEDDVDGLSPHAVTATASAAARRSGLYMWDSLERME